MPTNSATVTDAATGNEIATYSFTEDGITKHIQRVMVDNRFSSPPKRYATLVGPTTGVPGVAIANTNYMGVRKLLANPDAYLTRIQINQYNAAAGLAVPLLLWRATAVAGGTLIATTAIQDMDTAAAAATLEMRHGAVTGTKVGQPLMAFGPSGTGAIGQSAQAWVWDSRNVAERLRLTGDEGLIIDGPIAADTDNRYFFTIEWEEV